MTKYDNTGVYVDYDDYSNDKRIELKRHDHIIYYVEGWNCGEYFSAKYYGVVAKQNGEFGIKLFQDYCGYRFVPFSKMADPNEECSLIKEGEDVKAK